MGGLGQFALSQATPDQITALQQQLAPATAISSDSTQTQVQPQTPPPASSGYSSDIANPSAMPINSPTAPGSVDDLQNQGAQLRQGLAQPQQQQPQQQQGAYSPENPFASMVQEYGQKYQAMQPKPVAQNVKGVLQNFFMGMGNGMMHEAGLPTMPQQRQQAFQNYMTMAQAADTWEQMKGAARYRDALTMDAQQRTAFEAQMEPLRLQQEQAAVQQAQQNLQQSQQTIHPAMSGDDLKALGVPDDLAAQYAGHPLGSADMAALKDLSAAGTTRIYDYGQDGQGQGKGQWLVDRNYNPIKQLSPISETGRATALQKQQFAQQQALMKGMQSPVYAYDPNSKQTVLTTQAQAQQGGMQAIRGVKESDITKDTHDTRVLNDVATKANAVLDASNAMDTWNPAQMKAMQGVLDAGNKDSQLEIGAFGARFPTSWWNTLSTVAQQSALTQSQRNYVVAVANLREASMGMQRVLTGSARANEAQINALQATLPGIETDSAMVRQKLGAFTQNVDLLRQGIPRMPGLDVVPVRTWSNPQSSVNQSVGNPQQQQQQQRPQTTPMGMNRYGNLGSFERKALGLE